MVSKAVEEYLKVMYVINKNNGDVRVTDVAIKLKCTKPSVNKALKALKREGLVNYVSYGKIEITEEGNKIARKAIEAYDILYLFLTEILELETKKAEEEAEKIKATASDETLNHLAKYVHKVLDLSSLECNYNIDNEKCIKCIKKTSRDKIVRGEM